MRAGQNIGVHVKEILDPSIRGLHRPHNHCLDGMTKGLVRVEQRDRVAFILTGAGAETLSSFVNQNFRHCSMWWINRDIGGERGCSCCFLQCCGTCNSTS